MDPAPNRAVSRPVVPNKLEANKSASHFLRGTLASELTAPTSAFSAEAEPILKHHGIYQQDNRDLRRSGQRQHSFLVRTRLPGGKLTAAQLLTELRLCDELGDGTLRITDRQGLQLHGVLKGDLQDVIRQIDAAKLTTFGACGDVVRNVMCCPAPVKGSVIRTEMQSHADTLARHFALRSRAYHEIWLSDGETSTQVNVASDREEPVYGAAYLPRKFKFALALADDNCVDALTHDVGFVALAGVRSSPHFNVYVGGGMGVTPARTDTFPAIALPMACVPGGELLALADAIVQVQREFGNRCDRKRARFKYLIADWGLERFRETLQRAYGKTLAPAESIPVVGLQDHLGWHEQEGGFWFLGLSVENGRIRDTDDIQLKSALSTIAARFPITVRITPLQDLLLCDIHERFRDGIEQVLREHHVLPGRETDALLRLAMACPALPTCGLAITESERVMPGFLNELQRVLGDLNLAQERISIRMTGCPNGCSRPYVAEIGIVGKAVGRYSLFLGGSVSGTRLGFLFRDLVTLPEIIELLRPILTEFATSRQAEESFGDYCFRVGEEHLAAVSPAE